MNRYETMFIINPELGEDEIQGVMQKFSGIIAAQGGEQLLLEDWGRRRLAYKIKKFTTGHYVLLDFAGEPAVLAELERNLKIDDRIIRFLSIKTGDKVDVAAVRASLAARAKPQPEVVEAEEGIEEGVAAPETEISESPAAEATAAPAAPAESEE